MNGRPTFCFLHFAIFYIHVNPERSFRGTNGGPSSEARRALEGGPGSGVLPRKFSETRIANGAI